MTWNMIILGLAVYFVLWWLTLLLVLPFGVRTQAEDGEVVEGSTESAPSNYRAKRVLIINTCITSVIFGVFCYFTLVLGWDAHDLIELSPSLL